MIVVVDDPRDHGLGLRIVLQVVLVTSYEYDDAGRQDTVVAPAGIVTDTEYDDRAAAAFATFLDEFGTGHADSAESRCAWAIAWPRWIWTTSAWVCVKPSRR